MVLYRQSGFPVLQNLVFESEVEAQNCPTGDIEIVEDSRTGLVYNRAFDPNIISYDKDYDNEQALSPTFREHLNDVVEIVERELGRDALVEVGCGKGFFLELCHARGLDVIGYDKTYAGSNPRAIKSYFEPSTVISPASGLVLRHVLEHVQNPFDFLSKLRDTNGGGGLIYIEVPCFDWILKRNAWFDIFYEHVNYFRLTDFERMFGSIVTKGHSFGGQYLYIVADLSSLKVPTRTPRDTPVLPDSFKKTLSYNLSNNEEVFVWGAGSKGVIFSLLLQRAGFSVAGVVDLNSRKQGKFLPVSGVKVFSPKQALDNFPAGAKMFVMNSNYYEEISKMSENKFKLEKID